MTGSEYARISGSYSTAFIGTYQVIGQNTANNTTTFRLRGYFYYGGGTQVSSSYSTFKVNGTNVKTGSYTYSPGYHLLGQKDITITHNNDGSFPTTNASIYANSYHMNGSASGRIYANTIPRASQPSCITYPNNTENVGYIGDTITIHMNRKSSSFTHRVRYSWYNRSNVIANNVTNNCQWTIPNIFAEDIPNSITSWGTIYADTYNGNTLIGTKSCKFICSVTDANPTFNNFEFEDVNLTTLALTGNNQNIIQGYSNVKATIPINYIATANKYATMSKYSFTCSDMQRDIPYSNNESTSNIIENVKSGVFNVYAIDSRNNSTLVTKNANQTIAYNQLAKGNISILRDNGVSEETKLTLNGFVDLVDFGEVVNSIKTSKYRYKPTDSSTWSSYTDITLTIDENGNFTFSDYILGDTNNGFNIGDSYNIEVLISDELSNITFTANLNSGVPNIALHKNGVGIMGKYDTNEGGLLQIASENIFSNKILWENASGEIPNFTEYTLNDNIYNYRLAIVQTENNGNIIIPIIENNTSFRGGSNYMLGNGSGMVSVGVTAVITNNGMKIDFVYLSEITNKASSNHDAITHLKMYKIIGIR